MWCPDRLALLPEEERLKLEPEVRQRINANLLCFPETAALSPLELEAAIDRIIKESQLETASPAAPGMVRLNDNQIRALLWSGEATPTVDELLGDDAGGVFPPGWIEARRLEMNAECRPEKKTPGHRMVIVDKIRVDLIARGYVEVLKEYIDPDYDPDYDSGSDGSGDEDRGSSNSESHGSDDE